MFKTFQSLSSLAGRYLFGIPASGENPHQKERINANCAVLPATAAKSLETASKANCFWQLYLPKTTWLGSEAKNQGHNIGSYP